MSYLDQMRVNEALSARDQAIYKMESVCASNRAKDTVIAKLRQEKENLETRIASGVIMAEKKSKYCEETEALRKSNAELTAKLESLSLGHEGTPVLSMASIRCTR